MPDSDSYYRYLLGALVAAAIVAIAAVVLVNRSSMRPGPSTAAAAPGVTAPLKDAICTGGDASGVGLRGEYYAGENASGTALLQRVDGRVDSDVLRDWPASLIGSRPRSARWSGWLRPPLDGAYRFHLDRAGALVQIAKNPVVGAGVAAGTSMELSAGRYYAVLIEVPVLTDAEPSWRLEWSPPRGVRYPVPQTLLHPPVDVVK